MLGAWSLELVGTMFHADRKHVGAMLGACLVLHVSIFLGEVCKHYWEFGKMSDAGCERVNFDNDNTKHQT